MIIVKMPKKLYNRLSNLLNIKKNKLILQKQLIMTVNINIYYNDQIVLLKNKNHRMAMIKNINQKLNRVKPSIKILKIN